MWKNFSAKIPSLLLGASVAVTVVLYTVWLTLHKSYPSVDSAQMFCLSLEIFAVFKSAGLAAGLAYAYWHKHWRPLIFPLLITPLMALTDGKILSALKLATFIMLFLNIYIVLKYIRLYSRSVIGAFTFSVFFLTYAFAVTVGNFGSETFLISGFLALFYIWFKNQGKLEHGRSYFLFMALWSWTCLCRPVEAMTLGLPLFLVTTWRWRQSKLNSLLETASAFVLAVFGITILLYPYNILGREWSPPEAEVILLLDLSLSALLLWLNGKQAKYLIGFVAFLTPLVAWYVTGASTLLGWVHSTSYGPLAVATGGAQGKSYYLYWDGLRIVLGHAATVFLILGVILALSKRLNPALGQRRFLLWTIAYLLLNVVLSSFTYNWDHRYIFPNILALVLVCGKVISDFYDGASIWARRLTASILSVFTVFILAGWAGVLFTKNYSFPVNGFTVAGWFFYNPRPGNVLEEFKKRLLWRIPENETVIATVWQTSYTVIDVNAWTLQMIAWDNEKNWAVKNLMNGDEFTGAANKAEFFADYQYLLVGPMEQDQVNFPGTESIRKWLSENCNPRECKGDGLEFVGSIDAAPSWEEPDTYYLIKNHKYRAKSFVSAFD